MSSTAQALRDCAKGLLRTAREAKEIGRTESASRLAHSARFYWRWYLQEISR